MKENLIQTNLMENGFFGVLNDISLEDYIQLICMKNATKGIRVSQQNDKGLILIRDGKVMSRMFFALAAVVPVLLLTIFFQSFSLTDKSPLPAFATSEPSPASSGKIAQDLEKSGSATITEKSRETPSPSITIGPLHKSAKTVPLREETILRLHGSNTIGAKLASALVSDYLTAVLGAEKVEQVAGIKENEVFLKARVKDQVLAVEIHAHGSTTGFTDIEAGGCDVAMASRKIKDKEVASLQTLGLGDMTAVTNEHVIALD